MALSSDGAHLYIGSTDSLDFENTSSGAMATFSSDRRTRALTYVGCTHRDAAISDVVSEPRRSSVLASTLFGNRGTGVGYATIDLYAPDQTGKLSWQRQLACIGPVNCRIPFSQDTSTLAITPRGNTVYFGVSFGGVASMRVGAPSLTLLPGRHGCLVSSSYYMPPRRCTRTGQEIGYAMAVSPDGRNLYVGTLGSGRGNYYTGGIETFSVQR